ncbi:Molybdenum cofactor biosynthesis protein MoaD [Marinobacterium lacunae]|uniref:Molybdopterin synthase sulfur carrier subunit n=1 Tax=Marinobacterium lacunae TaxID=1232683 RepID=A0A081G154_9GAMM|nr:molybdopterin converting factor subunit 1 [Marinobacterium lacunae]KEA64509.1 Molybdenum cofactor biosynthesis protein MoaD [Marinobacterium lacunae]MBR9882403.1 molybdopterin converting factor subunit 1 [Oceanospirillales bacterium]
MKLVYFASVREQLGIEGETLSLPLGVTTVAGLVEWLAVSRGEPWAAVLRDQRLLCAVNQEMCSLEAAVSDNDEVAFFPPVTGG